MLKAVALLSGVVFLFCSCAGPSGRIMDDSEEDYVDTRGAGAATFDRLIEGAVQKLLLEHSASTNRTDKMRIATMEVENAGSEELLDWREQIYDLITTSINQSGRYRTVSKRFVDAALRETRLRPDDLFLPAKMRQYTDVLEAQGNPTQALLFPKLTTGTTQAADRQRNYVLTLELVDVASGWNEQVSERIRKEFDR